MGECFFWYRPTRVVPDQRPLNGRRCCCCCSTYDVCSCSVIAEIVLYCAFVWHVRGHSEPFAVYFNKNIGLYRPTSGTGNRGRHPRVQQARRRKPASAKYYYYYFRPTNTKTQAGKLGQTCRIMVATAICSVSMVLLLLSTDAQCKTVYSECHVVE